MGLEGQGVTTLTKKDQRGVRRLKMFSRLGRDFF